MPYQVLHSWKEIARHLKAGVRTVQRWERERGLPVRRPHGELRSAVMAVASELDDWRIAVQGTNASGNSLMQPTLPIVVVVDDSDIHRYALARTLAKEGFSVLEASSGESALRLLKCIVPAVIVVDIRMPQMDGFAVCRKIKRNASLSATPVV